MSRASFSDIFIGISQRHPGRIAVEAPGVRLGYRGFVALASQMARDLAAQGIGPGSRVGIAVRRNEDILLQMSALWMLGAVAVPMDFRTRVPERLLVAQDLGLAAILEERTVDPEGRYRSIVTDGDWLTRVAQHPSDPVYSPAAESPALIALTSGTTGKRVGAIIDHEQLLMRISLPAGLARRDEGGRMLNLSPLSFCASIHNTLAHMWNCGTVVFFPALFSAQEVADAIPAMRITSVFTVPAVVRGLLDVCADRNTPAFGELSYLYCSGAPLGPREKQLAQQKLTRNFVEIYASMLTGRMCLLDSHQVATRPDSVGQVLPQVNLQVVGSDGRPLPAGEAGAIRVRAPGMTLSLCGTAVERHKGDRIVDGWVYTGDVGRLDNEGFLCLLGRDSEMIIRGGENVYPAEVEAVALQMPGVSEAVVVGFPSALLGEEIAMFLVATSAVSERDVVAHFRARLTPAKTPRAIRFVDSLPRNENGKIRYAELKQRLALEPQAT